MKGMFLIDVENVSKRYCRNLKRSILYGVQDIAKELIGRSQEASNLRPEEFWALQDVTFQVREGESVGLIGHNGAGKTTLLKLINGLIKPTRGRIMVNGSVRALIALGAGFNPVLSGRENIWISGAVLGYRDDEMKKKFDEIVAFSELGDFIDTPVQSYSSGMLARLGFSVAIHSSPDILLVDEVLAVGDLNFAIKCYRKISDFRSQGGSIVLVSHNPYTIRTNCDRAVWIEKGRIQKMDKASEVCGEYELFVGRQDNTRRGEQYLDETLEIVDATWPLVIQSGEDFVFEIRLKANRTIDKPIVGISIFNVTGQNVLSNTWSNDDAVLCINRGITSIRVIYNNLPLSRGVYYVNLVIAEMFINNQLLALINCYKFEVKTDPDYHGAGMFILQPRWECES